MSIHHIHAIHLQKPAKPRRENKNQQSINVNIIKIHKDKSLNVLYKLLLLSRLFYIPAYEMEGTPFSCYGYQLVTWLNQPRGYIIALLFTRCVYYRPSYAKKSESLFFRINCLGCAFALLLLFFCYHWKIIRAHTHNNIQITYLPTSVSCVLLYA